MMVLFSTEMHTEMRGSLSFSNRTRSTVLTALAVLTSEFFLGVSASDWIAVRIAGHELSKVGDYKLR